MLVDKLVTVGRKVKWLCENRGQMITSFKDPFKKDTHSGALKLTKVSYHLHLPFFFVIDGFLKAYKTSEVVNGQTWLVILLVSLSPSLQQFLPEKGR